MLQVITLHELLDKQSELFRHICDELTSSPDTHAGKCAAELSQHSDIVTKVFAGSAGDETGGIVFEDFRKLMQEVKLLMVQLEKKKRKQETIIEARRKADEEEQARVREEERAYQQAQAELQAQQAAEEDEMKKQKLREELAEAKRQRVARRQEVLAEREAKQAAEEEERKLDRPMQQLFDLIDCDQSTLITLPEFKASAKQIVDYLTKNKLVSRDIIQYLPSGRLVSVFSRMDSDGSGVLDFSEFKGLCNQLISHCQKLASQAKSAPVSRKLPADEVSKCFNELDKDSSGALSMYEILEGAPVIIASLGIAGSQMSMVRVTKIFKQISKGHSDVVTLDQFRQMINKLKEVRLNVHLCC